MKFTFGICIILMLSFTIKAQVTIPSRMIYNNSSYKIDLTLKENGEFEYKIINSDKPEDPVRFTLIENVEAAFRKAFTKAIAADATNIGFKSSDDPDLRLEASQLFYYFKAGEILRDDLDNEPIAGYLTFNNRTTSVYKVTENAWILRAKTREIVRTYKMNSMMSSALAAESTLWKEKNNEILEIELALRAYNLYDANCKIQNKLEMAKRTLEKQKRDSLNYSKLWAEAKLKADNIGKYSTRRKKVAEQKQDSLFNKVMDNKARVDSLRKLVSLMTYNVAFSERKLQELYKGFTFEEINCAGSQLEIDLIKFKYDLAKKERAKINEQIALYTSSGKTRLGSGLHKRWYAYKGNRYSRRDLRIRLQEELPKSGDSTRVRDYYNYLNKVTDSVIYFTERWKKNERDIADVIAQKDAGKKKYDTTFFRYKNDSITYFRLIRKLEGQYSYLPYIPNVSSDQLIISINKIIPPPTTEAFQYWFDNEGNIKNYYGKSTKRGTKTGYARDSIDYQKELKVVTPEIVKLEKLETKQALTSEQLSRLYDLQARRAEAEEYLIEGKKDRFLFDNYNDIKKYGNTYAESFSKYLPEKKAWEGYEASLKTLEKIRTECLHYLDPVKDSLKKKLSRVYDPTFYRQQLQISNIELEINEGLIENIYVKGRLGNSFKYINSSYVFKDTLILAPIPEIKLENRHPFGFSRKVDYEDLRNKYLFTVDNHSPYYRLYLKDVLLAYVQRHEVNRRDYSPADMVVRVAGNSTPTEYILHKDPTYRLFEAKVFSDFVGLNKNNPNGLIQTEIDKRITLRTRRYPIGKYEALNIGIVSYVMPSVVLSKLEDNNKDLLLRVSDDTVNGKYSPRKYASTLELRRHENFSTGVDANLLTIDIPTGKSTFLLDAGFRYGRVSIVDSIKNNIQGVITKSPLNYGVNTFRVYPKVGWLVNSDGRYSVYMESSFNIYWLRDNRFKQVANEDVFQSSFQTGTTSRREYVNFLFQLSLKTGTEDKRNKGKLFFRYQYNYQWNYFNTGFHQAQVGYSFYLLGNNRSGS
jgi:hypothetical protein